MVFVVDLLVDSIQCTKCQKWNGFTGSVVVYPYAYPSALTLPSVLRHCWLGSRNGIRPVKKLDW